MTGAGRRRPAPPRSPGGPDARDADPAGRRPPAGRTPAASCRGRTAAGRPPPATWPCRWPGAKLLTGPGGRAPDRRPARRARLGAAGHARREAGLGRRGCRPGVPLPGRLARLARRWPPRCPNPTPTLAGRALAVVTWRRTHRWCGACRAELADVPGETRAAAPGAACTYRAALRRGTGRDHPARSGRRRRRAAAGPARERADGAVGAGRRVRRGRRVAGGGGAPRGRARRSG